MSSPGTYEGVVVPEPPDQGGRHLLVVEPVDEGRAVEVRRDNGGPHRRGPLVEDGEQVGGQPWRSPLLAQVVEDEQVNLDEVVQHPGVGLLAEGLLDEPLELPHGQEPVWHIDVLPGLVHPQAVDDVPSETGLAYACRAVEQEPGLLFARDPIGGRLQPRMQLSDLGVLEQRRVGRNKLNLPEPVSLDAVRLHVFTALVVSGQLAFWAGKQGSSFPTMARDVKTAHGRFWLGLWFGVWICVQGTSPSIRYGWIARCTQRLRPGSSC